MITSFEVFMELINKDCVSYKLVDDKDFQNAYNWLNKTVGYSNNPIWAWYQRGTETKEDYYKFCLEDSLTNRFENDVIFLELKVPDEEVTLTDYFTWHHVLNVFYLDEDLDDVDDFDFDRVYSQEEKEESWLRVFNIDRSSEGWIQATFPILKKEYVKRVRFTPNC